VFFFPDAIQTYPHALIAMAVVLVPALLMVSTIKFRSFKSFDLGTKRSYRGLVAMALVFAAVVSRPHEVLILLAYTYLSSAFVELAWIRLRGPRVTAPPPA
jgi:CDP-diacylglycerol--serine O-phosphatidyltransferase